MGKFGAKGMLRSNRSGAGQEWGSKHVSMLGLNLQRGGKMPRVPAWQPGQRYSLTGVSRARSRTSLEQDSGDVSWLRSCRDDSQECKGSMSFAQN